MAASIRKDFLKDSAAATRDKDGYATGTRVVMVEGLENQSADKMSKAIELVQAKYPIGSSLGNNYGLLRAETYSAALVSSDTVNVTVNYTRPELTKDKDGTHKDSNGNFVTMEINSALKSVEINRDIDGELLAVEFEDKLGVIDPKNPGKTYTQVAVVQGTEVSETRVFKGKTDVNPSQYSSVVNKLNSDTWMGGEARQWLCTGLQTSSPDNGKTWQWSISFAKDPRKWKVRYNYVDPTTGRMPKGLTTKNGIKESNVKDTVPFGDVIKNK